MFEVGDKVVHNDYGICRITGIMMQHFPGHEKREYYEMIPLSDDGYGTTYYTAVDHEGKLREPLSREQILSMIDMMPETKPLKIEPSGNRALDMENIRMSYNSLIRSGNPQDWVVLLRTIYRRGQNLSAQRKRISEFEAQARDTGERLLYSEIAGVMGIPLNEVEGFITARIEKNKR